MTTLISPISSAKTSDLVFFSQTNALVTDSFSVAKYFGKRHEQVLRKLKDLGCSFEFTKHNFVLCHKNNELQNGKLQPFYQMTKDGFMFLVMGFTGKRAAEIKERYINAFNEMEEQLVSNTNKLPALPDFTSIRMVLTLDKGIPNNIRVLDDDEFIIDRNRLDHHLRDPDIFSLEQLITAYSSIHNRIDAFLQHKIRR